MVTARAGPCGDDGDVVGETPARQVYGFARPPVAPAPPNPAGCRQRPRRKSERRSNCRAENV